MSDSQDVYNDDYTSLGDPIGEGQSGKIYKINDRIVLKRLTDVDDVQFDAWNRCLHIATEKMEPEFLPFLGSCIVNGEDRMTGRWIRNPKDDPESCELYMEYLKPFTKSGMTPEHQKGIVYQTVQLADQLLLSGKYVSLFFPDCRSANIMIREHGDNYCPVLIDLDTLRFVDDYTDVVVSYDVFLGGFDEDDVGDIFDDRDEGGAIFDDPLRHYGAAYSDVERKMMHEAFLQYISCTGMLFTIYEFLYADTIQQRLKTNQLRKKYKMDRDYPRVFPTGGLTKHADSKYVRTIYPLFLKMCKDYPLGPLGRLVGRCSEWFITFVTLAGTEATLSRWNAWARDGQLQRVCDIKAGFIDRALCRLPRHG